MKITNTVKGVVLAVVLIVASSCDLQDHLVNPSQLSPEQANNEYVFNTVQLTFAGFFLSATQLGMDNSRMLAMFGDTYEQAYTANSFNGVWSNAYSSFLVNANLLLDKTKENPATTEIEYNPYYQGVTKVLSAYVVVTLVDYFGDVPFLNALNPTNLNPAADKGADIYNNALLLLDAAIVDLNAVVTGTPKPTQDLYYAGAQLKWRKLANTLKLKIYLQRRLVDIAGSKSAIAALIAGNDMISSTAEEFIFTAPANSFANPNNYHPYFMANYLQSAGQYLSNFYMSELYGGGPVGGLGKPVKDPRLRYYFYRQVLTPTTDTNELTCAGGRAFPPGHYPLGMVYCDLPEGYWGRDHLDNSGTPPDGLKRTTYGLYPAGGQYDNNQGAPVNIGLGAKGKGILPIMMASFVQFMRAEYELMLNANIGAARVQLDLAVRNSIARVIAFNPAVVTAASGSTPSATGINNYVNFVLADYDATVLTPYAPNTTQQQNQLDVIVKEYWVALWGNGIEAYNTIRRTGKPALVQPALNANAGDFYRSFTYPAVYVIRNSTAVQKPNNKVKVFWDTNPDGFIK